MPANLQIGRVLRASTAGYAVGCRVSQLAEPAFGSLVKAEPIGPGEAVYGLIYNINIDDDPLVRRLVLAEKPKAEVIEDQRRNRLLPIEMSVLAIGYRVGADDEVQHGLPPRPPLNLDPVYLCLDEAELREVTDRPGYLRLILRAAGGQVPVDQLLVAHIRHLYQQRRQDEVWARGMIKELIELLRSNYDLLLPVLDALSERLPDLTPEGGE